MERIVREAGEQRKLMEEQRSYESAESRNEQDCRQGRRRLQALLDEADQICKPKTVVSTTPKIDWMDLTDEPEEDLSSVRSNPSIFPEAQAANEVSSPAEWFVCEPELDPSSHKQPETMNEEPLVSRSDGSTRHGGNKGTVADQVARPPTPELRYRCQSWTPTSAERI